MVRLQSSRQGGHLEGLVREKSELEGELSITLSETQEYRSLMERFPETRSKTQTLYESSKQHSAALLGKIKALTNYINLDHSQS